MTEKELLDRTTALIAERCDVTETRTSLFFNRVDDALEQVNAIRPMERRVRIFHRPIMPLSVFDVEHRAGETLTETCSAVVGLSYIILGNYADSSIRLLEKVAGSEEPEEIAVCTGGSWSGTGVAESAMKITDDGTEYRVKLNGVHNVIIEISGDGEYDIHGFGLYPYSVQRQPIYSDFIEYNVKEMVGETFLAFASSPVRVGEEPLYLGKDYLTTDTSVSFPFARQGVYDVYVQEKPGRYTGSTAGAPLKIADDLAPLVPYLLTYLILLPDEPQLAGYYKQRYEEMAAGIRTHTVRANGYANVTGWGK